MYLDVIDGVDQATLDSSIVYQLCYNVYDELGNGFIIDGADLHTYTSPYNSLVDYVILDVSDINVRSKIIRHLSYLYDTYIEHNVKSSASILVSDFYTNIPDYDSMISPSI